MNNDEINWTDAMKGEGAPEPKQDPETNQGPPPEMIGEVAAQDLAKMSTEELVALLQNKNELLLAQNSRMGEMQRALEEKDERIQSMEAEGAGWLVIAPQPSYNGVTAGVQFRHGLAFLADNRTFSRFLPPELKEETFDKLQYTAEQREEIRRRNARPTSLLAKEALVNDFGYEARYFDGSEQSEKMLQEWVAMRAHQYSDWSREQEQAERQAEQLIPPGYMGERT